MLRDRQEQISQGASAPGTCDMPASRPLPRHCTFAAFPGPSIAFRWPFAACVWPLAAFHWPFHCPVAHFLCQDTVPLAFVVPLPFLGRSLHLRCLLLDHSLAFCCLSAFPLRFRCLPYVLSTVLSPHFLDLSTALSPPFLDLSTALSQHFLGLPLPYRRLSLTFRCLSTAVADRLPRRGQPRRCPLQHRKERQAFSPPFFLLF